MERGLVKAQDKVLMEAQAKQSPGELTGWFEFHTFLEENY